MANDWERKLKRELKNETLKEFETWTPSEFAFYISQLREQITVLKEQLGAGSGNVAGSDQKQPLDEGMFRQDWSYPTKIHFLLELCQRPLTSEDLDKDLRRLDTHYKDYNSPQKNLSVHLNRSITSGRIKRIKQPGIKILHYALPEWVNNEGLLKSEYMLLTVFD